MIKKAIFEKNISLVLGGAGFIGSHLCDELIKRNKVVCIDDFSTGEEANIDHLLANPDFVFIKHDLNETLDLENIPDLQKFKIQFQGVQEIYNLACPTSPKDFESNIIGNLLTNSLLIKNALEMAMKYEAKFLHFSSSVVYGSRRTDNKRIPETDIGFVDCLSDRSSYDEGKRFAETMIHNYRKVYNIDAKIIRLFRTYGPRMKLDQGHLISDIINNALDNKDIEIFGDENFYSSFCYISDVIDATIKMMNSDLHGPINIGSDVDVNVTAIANKIIEMTKSKSKIAYKDKIVFLTTLCLPDITKARNELGWLPIVTLEKGLEATVNDLRAGKGLIGIKNVN
jgi:UDP-glucuronate decarboxylase